MKNKTLLQLIFTGVAFVTLQSSGCKEDSAENALYGTTGPAGGLIFYDKGHYSDGWRYLEAAPYDAYSQVFWGCELSVGGLGSGIGDGEENTTKIIQHQINQANNTSGCYADGIIYTAAKVCANFTANGYSDWFLPSEAELDLMIENLHHQGLSNMNGYYSYWSSSESSSSKAYVRTPDDYSGATMKKYLSGKTRAIRAY